MKSKSTRGGKRPGAGRPRKEETTVLTFRVPVRWASEIKTTVTKWIKDLKNENKIT